MADSVSRAVRSHIMASVKREHTKPERIVRSLLHSLGYRFRLHRKDLPGSPDIVLPLYKTAIFVHGCFWHQHVGCKKSKSPTSNIDYWEKKFKENIERDKNKIQGLKDLGWSVFIIWECEIKDQASLILRFKEFLNHQNSSADI